MSGTTNYNPFTLVAREGIGNIQHMLKTIKDTLPAEAEAHIDLSQRTLQVNSYFEEAHTWIRDVLGLYASQLEDTEPSLAETEDGGEWFWRIRNGRIEDTDAVLQPDENEWSAISPYDQKIEELGTGRQLPISEREAVWLVVRRWIERCDECDCYHPTPGTDWLRIEKGLEIDRA